MGWAAARVTCFAGLRFDVVGRGQQTPTRACSVNPYEAPKTRADLPGSLIEPAVHPAARVFAGLLATSGAVFVPLALFPLLTPGIVVWIGWVCVAFGAASWNRFWWFSLGWNIFTASMLLTLAEGSFRPINAALLFVWLHLLTAVVGSGLVLLAKYETQRLAKKIDQP